MSCQTSVPEDLRSSLKPYSESKHVIQLDQNFPPDQTGQLLLLPGFGMQGGSSAFNYRQPFCCEGRKIRGAAPRSPLTVKETVLTSRPRKMVSFSSHHVQTAPLPQTIEFFPKPRIILKALVPVITDI